MTNDDPPQAPERASERAPEHTSPRALRPVLVWDLPVRLFHWLAVALVGAAWLTLKLNWIDWHVRAGEALLALLVFRVLWGCVGSETAQFRRFVASPAAALRHVRTLFVREPDEQIGHNPAGGWMVLLLLTLLLVETLTGLYVNNEIADEGPLSASVPVWLANGIAALHGYAWDALVAAIALHVSVIALYARLKGQHLLRPMLTGYKHLPPALRAPRRRSPLLAAALLALAVALVALLAAAL